MRIIAISTLNACAAKHPDAAKALEYWKGLVLQGNWNSPPEVQAAFSKAKVLNDERVRFEIRNGYYRLIASFDFGRRSPPSSSSAPMPSMIAWMPLPSPCSEEGSMDIRPIRTEADHRSALARIEALWNADPGTDEGDELDVLVDLVEAYEARHYPAIAPLDPIDAIREHMDLIGRTQADLTRLLGSSSRSSEIMGRHRRLTVKMIRMLVTEWHMPADVLIAPYREAA